jgi:microcystin-dependent protein
MNKKLIAVTILLLIVSFVAWFQISRAVTLPSGPALFETSLQSRISSTDTSMTLVANSLRGGQSITGYNCFTIDEGRSDSEYVCGTVSGTSVTSLERGLSFTTGTTTVVALEKAHRKGADVKITDFPLIQRLRNQNNGGETYPNLLSYTAGTDCAPGHATNVLCSGTYLEFYANNVIAGGAPTSTEATGGKVELGTLAEQAASFDGGAAKPTVLQTKNSTSTCQVTGSYALIASTTTGKLDGNCIGGATNYVFTASTTLATTTKIGETFGGLSPVGSITAYASTTAPSGWLLANGSSVLRTAYPALFSIIGTSYGSADGTHFTLPDLRGRNVLMASTTANLGQSGGESNHTQTLAELAPHTHGISGFVNGTGSSIPFSVNSNAASGSTDSAGGGAPMNVLDPYLVLNYIIKY